MFGLLVIIGAGLFIFALVEYDIQRQRKYAEMADRLNAVMRKDPDESERPVSS